MADMELRLRELLKRIAFEQDYRDCDIQVKPISSGGANYSSVIYVATITAEGKDDLQLFAKVGQIDEIMRAQIGLKPFDTERYVYTELMQTYRHLEEKHGVPSEFKLGMSAYYGADETFLHETLVLENLVIKGFVCHDRLKPVDWQYAAAALTELAKFHALSIAYQHEQPENYAKTVETLKGDMYLDNEGTRAYFKGAFEKAVEVVKAENKEKLKKYLMDFNLSKYLQLYRPLRCEVIVHIDYRPSNIMHRSKPDGSLELIPFDYQSAQGGCAVIDLLYFVITATDGPFRARYYRRLVDHYHAQLGAALARLHLDVHEKYSKEDFEFELKEKLPYGLVNSLLVLPTVTVDEAEAPALDDPQGIAKFAVAKTGPLYTSRINEIVDDYVAWGIL